MAFEIDPQPVYIYDTSKKKTLMFDGVLKVQHTAALKIEDDPDNVKKGKGFVNNAKNEANEVIFNVIMSPVYTTKNDLAGSSGNRSKNAYSTLLEVKVARRKVQVITTLKTYNNMLIKSIQILQDETNPYGWEAEIAFHEVLTSAGKASSGSTQSSKAVDDGTTNGRTPSIWVSWVGANAIT